MIYKSLCHKKSLGLKQIAVLVDPDRYDEKSLYLLIESAILSDVDYFFVGGSLMISEKLEETVIALKESCGIPIILFPGSTLQITDKADGVLFLSVISGRNADMLIGQQVVAAPYVKRAGIEVISTGYMLVDSGRPTTAAYMSNSTPIPADKPEIAMCTAMAGEMLGMKLMYLDGGSGAQNNVSEKIIAAVSENVKVPVVVGGGIRNAPAAERAWRSGADVVVVGNVLEEDTTVLNRISSCMKDLRDASYSDIQPG